MSDSASSEIVDAERLISVGAAFTAAMSIFAVLTNSIDPDPPAASVLAAVSTCSDKT